jgi:putative protease
MKHTKVELLAPAGNLEKLHTALHFGADAVYLAGKNFGLRAFADNFTAEEMTAASNFAHNAGKKVYVTVNIFAKNDDFAGLEQYLHQLENAKVDAVIVSDLGVFNFVKTHSNLAIHVSTQANTTNIYAVNAWSDMGAQRVVLARELSLTEIEEIHEYCPQCELEAFVHGAMCISYSGRCLMSNYLTGRDSNRGACVQACRWEWDITEKSRSGSEALTVKEDGRGTYIFNSKDLNMLPYIDRLMAAGVVSFKIEGRMKSPFYVATVTNAYRHAIDSVDSGEYKVDVVLLAELNKASHRSYTTGFFVGEDAGDRQYYDSSKAVEEYKFIAKVVACDGGVVTVEQRNKFSRGDTLEVLSASKELLNKTFVADNMTDPDGNSVIVANKVQQILKMPCPYALYEGDLLRMK